MPPGMASSLTTQLWMFRDQKTLHNSPSRAICSHLQKEHRTVLLSPCHDGQIHLKKRSGIKKTSWPIPAPVRTSVSKPPREKPTFCPKACGWPGFLGESGKTRRLGVEGVERVVAMPHSHPWPGPSWVPSAFLKRAPIWARRRLHSSTTADEQLTGLGQAEQRAATNSLGT